MTTSPSPTARRTPLVPLEEARSFVLGHCGVLSPVTLATEEAFGSVLAEDAVAEVAVPGFDNSAMDGFALRAADCRPGRNELAVVEEVMAGEAAGGQLGPGQAARIMTGAPVPPGADTVCPLEDCLSEDGRLEIQGPLAPGAHIRRAGEDTGVGAVVAEAGAWLGAGLLGQLRAVGCHSVRVHRRPRVGVLSTGDELVHGAGRPGGINDSNRAMLGALLAAEGFSPVDLGVVADEPAAVTEALCEGVADCDAVVSTGGVSVGDRDVVRDVLTEVPTTAARWFQVAIKPAKPLAFAVVASPREVPVFGLPGNPVSALVSCELFAVPALRRMAGHRTDRRQVAAVAAVAFRRRPDHKVHLVASVATVDAEGVLEVRPTGPQGSHRLSSVAGANALAVVPNGEGIGAGERLQVLLVPGLGALGTEWSAPSAATAPVSDAASC